MRPINADEIVYESIDSRDTGRHEMYYGTGILAVRKEDIDAMPTIEPDRKKGEWLLINKPLYKFNGYKCSECGETILVFGGTNFCCNCGAKMERVE